MPEDKTSIYNSLARDCVYESKLEFLKLNRFLFELTLQEMNQLFDHTIRYYRIDVSFVIIFPL